MSESASSSRSDLRASDAEREAVVAQLRDHAAQGRLSADELAERVERAYAASTRAQLSVLTGDLPAPESEPVREPRRRGMAGVLRGEVGAFVLVNALLIAIWAASGAGYFWPMWPLMGWGLGLVACGSGRKASAFGGRKRSAIGHCGWHHRHPGVGRRSTA